MSPEEEHGRGITRREAIAGGATALAVGMLSGPAALADYPGAYVQETSKVTHTVVPATTNLLAVIGAFPSGPVGAAVPVTSWAQFATMFDNAAPGADSGRSMAWYAVHQFFLNGGTGAFIVRLAAPGSATAEAALGPLTVRVTGPGAWANGSNVRLTPSGGTPDHLDLNLTDAAGTMLESLPGLIDDGSATGLAAAVNKASSYLIATQQGTGPVPTQAQRLSGGADGSWSPAGFADAVLAQVSQPGSSLRPGLDGIAPQAFNLMCIPDAAFLSAAAQVSVIEAAHLYCKARQAFLIVDPPPPTAALAAAWLPGAEAAPVDAVGGSGGPGGLIEWAGPLNGPQTTAAALYYPWVRIADPENSFAERYVPPSGSVAGVYAANDTTRGVWKAPAGTTAALQGVTGLADATLDDETNGTLNVRGINCLRTFPVYDNVVWGARTLAGADLAQSGFKYVPVRRLADFIEQSVTQSLTWATFEPDGPQLWSDVTLEVHDFMAGLYAAGAFSGDTAAQAYTVTCDAATTTPADVQQGTLNVTIGFQPSVPSEFVMLNVTVNAGSAAAT